MVRARLIKRRREVCRGLYLRPRWGSLSPSEIACYSRGEAQSVFEVGGLIATQPSLWAGWVRGRLSTTKSVEGPPLTISTLKSQALRDSPTYSAKTLRERVTQQYPEYPISHIISVGPPQL